VFAGWAELHNLNWREYRYVLVLGISPPPAAWLLHTVAPERVVLVLQSPVPCRLADIPCRFMYDGNRLHPTDAKVSLLPSLTRETLGHWIPDPGSLRDRLASCSISMPDGMLILQGDVYTVGGVDLEEDAIVEVMPESQ
jgi:hypothetical protein